MHIPEQTKEEKLKEILKDVTRITFIDRTGKIGSFEIWKADINPMLQDKDRTLKIEVESNPKAKGFGDK